MHLSWQIVKTYSFEHWTSLIWSPHLLNFFQDWDKPPVESARFQSVGADRVTNRHYRRCPASTDERGSGIITASQYQTRVYDHKVFVFAKHLLGCGWWTQLGWQWRFFTNYHYTNVNHIYLLVWNKWCHWTKVAFFTPAWSLSSFWTFLINSFSKLRKVYGLHVLWVLLPRYLCHLP